MKADPNYEPRGTSALLLASLTLIAACSGGGGDAGGEGEPSAPPEGDAPRFVESEPSANSTGVALSAVVRATFDGELDSDSVHANSVILRDGDARLDGSIDVSVFGPEGSRETLVVFEPIEELLPATVYTAVFRTGLRTLGGVELQEQVEVSFTTVALPAAAPTLETVEPNPGATNVPLNVTLTATFRGELDPDSVNADSVVLRGAGQRVDGMLSSAISEADGTRETLVRFVPDGDLSPEVEYTAIFTTDLMSIDGVRTAEQHEVSFTTVGLAPLSPSVASLEPANGSVDVPLGQAIVLVVEGELDPGTVTEASATLSAGGVNVARSHFVAITGATGERRSTITLRADALEYGTVYDVLFTPAIESIDGLPLVGNGATTFTTVEADRPTVDSHSPEDLAVDILLDAVITARFDTPMNADTIDDSSFQLSANGAQVAGSVAYDAGSRTATFEPTSDLKAGTDYEALLSSSIESEEGGVLEPRRFVFRTAPAPKIASTTPTEDEADVERDITIEVVFDVPMDINSINSERLKVRDASGAKVPSDVTLLSDLRVVQLTPAEGLAMLSEYTIEVKGSVRSALGVKLGQNQFRSFVTSDGAWRVASQSVAVNELTTADAEPDIAYSLDGSATAVFLEVEQPETLVFGARYTGAFGWQTKQLLDDLPEGYAGGPRVATSDSGHATAIWHWLDGDEIFIRSSRFDPNVGWSAAEYLSTPGNHHIRERDPRISATPGGEALAAWIFEDWFTNEYNVRYRRFVPGSGWGAPQQVYNAHQKKEISDLELAMDGSGNAVIAFVMEDVTGRARLHSSFARSSESFGPPLPIDELALVARNATAPRVAMEAGIAIAVWAQESLSAAGSSDWRDRMWANRLDLNASSTWDGPELVDNVDESNSNDPAVGISATGRASMIAWRQELGSVTQPPRFGYHAVDSNLAFPQGLTQPMLLDENPNFGSAMPQDFALHVDSSGNALVVYRSERDANLFDVFSRRYSSRNESWSAPERIEKRLPSAQRPRLSGLPDGRAVAVFFTYDGVVPEVRTNFFE